MDLDTLIATHRRPIERHLRRRVGDPSLAEDLAQEVFLRAWLHAPDLPELRLRAWLYRVATNVAIDALRARSGRVGGIASDGALLDALELATAAETEDHDERLAIEAALAQLPARERALVTLQFAGYGPTDAARLLQTTPEAARKRLTRARERFRCAYAASAPVDKPLVLLLVRDDDPALYERWLAGAELRVQRVSHAAEAARQLATAHALVLTGSDDDLHPALYGQEVRAARVGRLDADRADARILRDALAHGLPVLGMCRGHQLLNVVRGGTLHQDLGSDRATERPELHADRRVHAVATGDGSLTRRMVGTRAAVPSLHHQAIDALGRGLRVTSRSADGIVEGIEDPRHAFAVGVQWHAELPEAGIAGRRVRDALADAALRHAAAATLPVAA
jgi:putative glutamine amidotransferase